HHEHPARGAASGAAGVDRTSGAAVRILPERHDDHRGQPAGEDASPHGRRDQDRLQHLGPVGASVPVRHLRPDHQGGTARRRADGLKEQTMSIQAAPGTISRRSLLKAAGALVVMSAAVPAALRNSIAEAEATGVPFPTPELTDLATWLTVPAHGNITWRTGHVELGQGNRTALAQMVAEELDVAFDKVTL